MARASGPAGARRRTSAAVEAHAVSSQSPNPGPEPNGVLAAAENFLVEAGLANADTRFKRAH